MHLVRRAHFEQQASRAMTPSTRYRRIVVFFSSVAFQLFAWEWLLPRLGFRAVVERSISQKLVTIDEVRDVRRYETCAS